MAQHTAGDVLALLALFLWLGQKNAQVLLGLQNLQRLIFIGGCDDNLGENALDLLGHLYADLAVDGNNPAECGHQVAGVRRAVGRSDGLVRYGDATGVGVLDNRHTGALVVPGRAPRSVGVLVVVVAHFLAVELLGIGQTLGANPGDGGGLVGILAVAQRGGLLAIAELAHEPCGDRRIVVSGVKEGIAGEPTALVKAKSTLLNGLGHLAIARRIHDHGNGRVILGGRAHHGRSTDVDLLHASIEVRAGGYRFLEGIQVDHDELEGLYLKLVELRQVVFLAGIGQDPGVHARVERLHTAFQALGETGELFYRGDLDSQVSNLLGGGAGRDDLYARLIECAGQILQPRLVVHANECAFYLLAVFAHEED